MPKLSEKTLEKRFQCDYCGQTFRTRQGLSGHIQFKHNKYFKFSTKTKQATKNLDMVFITSKLKNFTILKAFNDMTDSTNENIVRLLLSWGKVSIVFKMLNIDLTENDFKTYLLMGLSKLFYPEGFSDTTRD